MKEYDSVLRSADGLELWAVLSRMIAKRKCVCCEGCMG